MSTQTFNDLNRQDTISHKCGVTMNDSADARVIAEVMEEKPGVEVLNYPAMIRLDTEGKLTFDMVELSEALGRTFTAYDFEVVMSTHYGRMVMIDEDTVVIFGDMDEALQYEE
jgi:propane monooxygenase coupling protein